jgi:hypothetical protein
MKDTRRNEVRAAERAGGWKAMPDGLDKLEAHMRERLGVAPDVERPDSQRVRRESAIVARGRRLVASIRGRRGSRAR